MPEVTLAADERQALQSELAACLARASVISALLHGSMPVPAAVTDLTGDWPALPDHRDLVTTGVAAERANVDATTIRKWCQSHSIGRAYGGRWRVLLTRLRAHLAA